MIEVNWRVEDSTRRHMARAFPLADMHKKTSVHRKAIDTYWFESFLINLILHFFVTLIFFYRLFYLPVFVE